jgi:hypothetical protein
MNKVAYFIFRGKETKKVVFFLESQWDNDRFPDAMMDVLRAVYSVERITQAEAETYEEFDVAPIITPGDVGVLLFGGEFQTKIAGLYVWDQKG